MFLALSLALFQLGYNAHSVLPEFEKLLKPILLRLGFGYRLVDLNSKTPNLELDRHDSFQTKCHPKGSGLNFGFECGVISPYCTL